VRWWCLTALVLSLLTGCGEKIEPGRTAADGPVIQGLGLLTIVPEPLAFGESFVGSVESLDRGVLAARSAGQVAEVKVNEGDLVRQGQLLLRVTDNQAADHSREAGAAVAEAQGSLAAARSRLDLAEKTLERYARLFANQALTRQELDQVEAEREQARQGVKGAEGALARAGAGQGAAARALAWNQIVAPYDGLVVQRQVEVGSTVMPGMPLLVIDRQGGWRVRAAIPESLAGRFAVGQTLAVELPARGETLTGTVREIVTAADPQSRSFEIKIELAPTAGLAAGLFARVQAPTVAIPALLVPARAMVERGQLFGLYLVQDGRLQFRLIRTGRRVGERVEILSGLQGGERIVVDGVERARDGARVEG
jgi:RND family efflux transporter MFP subunit